MSYLPTLSHDWLGSYPLFDPTDRYRYATHSNLIPFTSSRPADSNGTLPNSFQPLAVEISSSLYFYSPGKYLQIV